VTQTIPTLFGSVNIQLFLLGAGAVAALLCALLVPLAAIIARKVGAIDKPDPRRVHKRPTPRMGGLALFLSLVTVGFLCRWIAPVLFEGREMQALAVLVGATMIVALGMYDDIVGAAPLPKLFIQIAVAFIMFFGGLRLEHISWPFIEGGRIELGYWAIPITILWIAGLMNAVNLIDGLDGLCSGICAISSVVLVAILLGFETSMFVLIPALTAGVCVGFLYHNYNPASIFLGDTGSLLLGYLLACTTLTTGTKSTAVFTMLIPMLCIAIPVLDTTMAIIRRTSRGVHPFSPDREHLHHQLLGLGLSTKRVVWILWFLTAQLGLVAITLEKTNSPMLILGNAVLLLAGFLIMMSNLSFLVKAKETAAAALESASINASGTASSPEA